MRFALIDGAKAQFPVHRLCRMLGISQSGYFAWRGRPACRRQRDDMVLLAHIRSAFALSNGTYGSVALSGAVCPGRNGAPASIPPRVPSMTDTARAFRGFRFPAEAAPC